MQSITNILTKGSLERKAVLQRMVLELNSVK